MSSLPSFRKAPTSRDGGGEPGERSSEPAPSRAAPYAAGAAPEPGPALVSSFRVPKQVAPPSSIALDLDVELEPPGGSPLPPSLPFDGPAHPRVATMRRSLERESSVLAPSRLSEGGARPRLVTKVAATSASARLLERPSSPPPLPQYTNPRANISRASLQKPKHSTHRANPTTTAAQLKYLLRQPLIEPANAHLRASCHVLAFALDDALRRELRDLFAIIWSVQQRRYALVSGVDIPEFAMWFSAAARLACATLDADEAHFWPELVDAAPGDWTAAHRASARAKIRSFADRALQSMQAAAKPAGAAGESAPAGQSVSDVLESTEEFAIMLNFSLARKEAVSRLPVATLPRKKLVRAMQKVAAASGMTESYCTRDQDEATAARTRKELFPRSRRGSAQERRAYAAHRGVVADMAERLAAEEGCVIAETLIRDPARLI